MKKVLLITIMLIGAANVTVFGQQNKNVAKAQKENHENEKDLAKSEKKSSSEFQTEQKKYENKIEENDKKIAKLKSKQSTKSTKDKASYDKEIIALEHENDELKKQMAAYNEKK